MDSKRNGKDEPQASRRRKKGCGCGSLKKKKNVPKKKLSR